MKRIFFNGLSPRTLPGTKPLQNLYESVATRSSPAVNLQSARQPLHASSVETGRPSEMCSTIRARCRGDRIKLKSQDASVTDANEKQEIRSNRQRYTRAQHAYDLRGPFSASIGSQCGPKLEIDRFG